MVNINSNEKSDVYSFGVMFWEMLKEAWPYVDLISTESYSELFAVILSGKRPSLDGVSSLLVVGCLLLAVGCRLLVVGGCWLLIVS